MTDTTQPAEPKLLPCPLCGAKSGYALTDGSTYRWWRVQCVECGQELSECRSNGSTRLDDPKPARCQQADDAWNEAGAHAAGLRRKIAELEEMLAKAILRAASAPENFEKFFDMQVIVDPCMPPGTVRIVSIVSKTQEKDHD